MRNILIFSNDFFPLSATFIHRQIQGPLKENKIILVSFKYTNEDKFPLPGVVKIKLKPYYGWLDRLLFFVQKKITGIPGRISIVGRKVLKNILRARAVDVIHAHYGTMAAHILPVAKKSGIPLIISFHGYDASIALNRKWYKKQLKELFDYASAIIIVSEHMRSTLKLSSWDNKVHLIPYGIDVNKFTRTKARDRHSETNLKILHSGRIAPKKGVPDLIRIFSIIAEKYIHVSLHILGEGQEREACTELVKQQGLQGCVFFYGAKPQEDVIRLMDECHIFVLNSRTSPDGDMEGLPNSILEAMSMEMAVVSTYHAGIPDVIDNGINGLLVPEKDNDAVYHALIKLIEDKTLMKSLGNNARKKIATYFTVEEMQKRINSLYASITLR